MKTYSLILFVCFVTDIVKARGDFSNPILTRNSNPSVIKVEDVYYMVTDSLPPGNIAIYSSSNLKNWKFENYVFTPVTSPVWAPNTSLPFYPEIHYVDDSYNVYFNAFNAATNFSAIGVASAPTPTGPFQDIGQPLWQEARTDVYFPNLVHSGNTSYIFYIDNRSRQYFKAFEITSDGLGILENHFTSVGFTNSRGAVFSSCHLKHEDADYLLHTAGGAFKVAKSVDGTLGPYEVRAEPMLPRDYWEASVVKDLDNEGDVIFFGLQETFSVYSARLEWQSDGPVIAGFSP